MKWVEVGNAHDIAPGQMKPVGVEGVEVLLANVDGKIYACRDRCGHQNAPLSMGRLDGRKITCPLHGAVFDITTGQNLEGLKLANPQEMGLPKEMIEMYQANNGDCSESENRPVEDLCGRNPGREDQSFPRVRDHTSIKRPTETVSSPRVTQGRRRHA
jgi:nitrite reductase/ring-hydroxylating ferredoxin subunit